MMDADDFIALVARGDEQAALRALERDPRLASARDGQGISVICLAVYRRQLGLVGALKARRAELDLFEAACVGDVDAVRAALAADPDSVNRASPDGFGPLGYAAFFGHRPLLRELLARGADPNAPSQNAMRVCALHSAAATREPATALALAEALLAAGADPNAKQQGGFTALQEAARRGHLALCELLLARGADPELANDQGSRAIDFARDHGHAEVVRALERR